MKSLLKKYRRDLHSIPEIGYDVYKTKAYIMEQLRQYRCEITELCGTAVCAYFRSEMKDSSDCRETYTVAIRSDMDALPMTEGTDAAYASIHEGAMHACGHDGHMAMLLSLAGELDHTMHTIPHNVLLIFQPAEETIGGAKDICASGILSTYKVNRIYAFHLLPMLKKHAIGSRANEIMSRSCELDITIHGKSSHSAFSNQGIDALAIGCELVIELYNMVQAELPETEYRLLKFGRMKSGSVRNAVSSSTVLQGTLRSFRDDTFQFLGRRIREISQSYEKKYQCKINISQSLGYPPVINDPDLFEEAKVALSEFDFHTFKEPLMLSEDFSSYQQLIPGLLLFLGTGTDTPLHSNTFDFDEDILATGVEAYLKLLK